MLRQLVVGHGSSFRHHVGLPDFSTLDQPEQLLHGDARSRPLSYACRLPARQACGTWYRRGVAITTVSMSLISMSSKTRYLVWYVVRFHLAIEQVRPVAQAVTVTPSIARNPISVDRPRSLVIPIFILIFSLLFFLSTAAQVRPTAAISTSLPECIVAAREYIAPRCPSQWLLVGGRDVHDVRPAELGGDGVAVVGVPYQHARIRQPDGLRSEPGQHDAPPPAQVDGAMSL